MADSDDACFEIHQAIHLAAGKELGRQTNRWHVGDLSEVVDSTVRTVEYCFELHSFWDALELVDINFVYVSSLKTNTANLFVA